MHQKYIFFLYIQYSFRVIYKAISLSIISLLVYFGRVFAEQLEGSKSKSWLIIA